MLLQFFLKQHSSNDAYYLYLHEKDIDLKNLKYTTMKKFLAIAILAMVTYTASAQHGRGRYVPTRSSHTVIRPQIRIGAGFGYGYNNYNRFRQPYYSPYYDNSYGYNRTTQLDLRIRDIENEYRERIRMVRNDKSISRGQRKSEIRSLRYEKERAVIEARRTYFNR